MKYQVVVFARKHDIFTGENNMLSSHVKYHRCYGYMINRAFHSKKILKWNGFCISFAALTREIFFNTWREISYLQAAL